MSDLLIVKVKDGINIKADMMGFWRNEIIKQKESGVIVLPWFLTAIVVPEDIEIKVEKSQEDKGVLEQLAEKQNTLSATNKAWSDAIDLRGSIY